MNIKALNIETVFSGFIHLLWITLLTIWILNVSPAFILIYLNNIGSGTSVLLIAVAFSLSFFFGRTAEHFFVAINFSRKGRIFKDNKVSALANNQGIKGEIWANKIFFFSSSIGLLFLGFLLYILTESWNAKLAIIVIGGILITATVVSTLYWKYLDNKVHENIPK